MDSKIYKIEKKDVSLINQNSRIIEMVIIHYSYFPDWITLFWSLWQSLASMLFTKFFSLFSRRFSNKTLRVYKNGLKAEFSGMTKVTTATLTSPGTAIPRHANRPSKPTGNQQRKSVTTIDTRRLASFVSMDLLLLSSRAFDDLLT